MSKPDVRARSGRVLILEDNADERTLYARRMREEGWEVVELESGETTLETALQFRPDVVVTDLRMPVQDGTDAARALKNDPRTERIPIIVLSGYVDRSREAYRAGCHTFLTKPCMADTLLEIMEAIMLERPSLKLSV